MKRGDEQERVLRQRGVWEECAWGPLTLGSSGTGAFVGIDQVNAGAPVLARLGGALIDLHRAVGPQVSWHALGGGTEGGMREEDTQEERRRKQEESGESLINVRHETKIVLVYLAVFWHSSSQGQHILYSRGD